MRFRALVAFLVGAVMFAVVPQFDTEIPGQGEGGELLLTATLTGALAGQLYYEVALEPPPREGFEVGSVVFGAVYAFAYSFPFVLVSALAATQNSAGGVGVVSASGHGGGLPVGE